MNEKMMKNGFLMVLVVLMSFGAANSQTYNSNAGGYNGGYGQVYQSFGVAQATINMQNTTNLQIQKLIMQQAMENKFGKKAVADAQRSNNSAVNSKPVAPAKTVANNAVFKPNVQSDSFKIIADTLGSNAEEKNTLNQIFAATKSGVEAEFAPKGRKNNLAAAMTFLMAATITVYHDAPEPSEKATENLFLALNLMFDEMPEMANVPNKDKQFLYDTYIAFGGLAFATHLHAKETNDKELLGQAKEIAGALLQDILKFNPDKIRFEGDSLKIDSGQTSNKTPIQNNKTAEKPTVSNNNSGITFPTTNFNDGWSATSASDFVQLSKNGVEVRLYFPNEQIDNKRPQNTNTFEPYYWDVLIKTAFNTGQTFVREKEQYSYGQADNWEASATDKKTGKSRYLGMRLVFSNGSCWTILVNAPDKTSYYNNFPTDSDFTKMLRYNKFAVAEKDLIGKWSSFNADSMQYYSIYSGNYAGTNTVSSNDVFVFNSNGTYQSEHAAASAFKGSVAYGKSTYKGAFNVSAWDLKAANRSTGDPGDFFCHFEAIKGGFLLKLTNKKYTGEVMSLFKAR